MNNDLVQVDLDTALTLYVKGYTHIPILVRDIGGSQDWLSLQPLYLDDLLKGIMAFASDSKRAELLNPPKTDIGRLAEEIALEYDVDDDPDWVETEPVTVETIPDEDEVPTVSKVTEESDNKPDGPPRWNILRVNKLSNEGWTNKQIAEEYGITEATVKERLTHYRMKS